MWLGISKLLFLLPTTDEAMDASPASSDNPNLVFVPVIVLPSLRPLFPSSFDGALTRPEGRSAGREKEDATISVTRWQGGGLVRTADAINLRRRLPPT